MSCNAFAFLSFVLEVWLTEACTAQTAVSDERQEDNDKCQSVIARVWQDLF